VIDYRVHTPLHEYLSEKYASEPFDTILDTMGIQVLYVNSPSYLKADGIFVNIGAMEGILSSISSAGKNLLWPRFLGGTPRNYVFQQTNPVADTMQYLIKLVEEGKLNVVIDRVFEMEEALQVGHIRCGLLLKLSVWTYLLTTYRHMSGYSVREQKVKLLSRSNDDVGLAEGSVRDHGL
jgi:NADPH:quinone reductase-like Zn-dependent oxidoreductase